MESGSTHVSPTHIASFPDCMLESGNEDKAATEPDKMWGASRHYFVKFIVLVTDY